MSQTKQATLANLKYHPAAREFVNHALLFAQKRFAKSLVDSHISPQQLLEGIREYALREFGMMTISVFRHWGITCTEDFGRIVWDLIERGDMRKTDRDQLSDFSGVYDFEDVFDRDYRFDTALSVRR